MALTIPSLWDILSKSQISADGDKLRISLYCENCKYHNWRLSIITYGWLLQVQFCAEKSLMKIWQDAADDGFHLPSVMKFIHDVKSDKDMIQAIRNLEIEIGKENVHLG